MIRKKCRKTNRNHRDSNTTTVIYTDVDNFVAHQKEEKLLDDKQEEDEQEMDPLG